MHFEPYTIYHIYNQGNDRQPIFLTSRDYLRFIQKMRKHLLPYVDILAYCLMPNHFHWMVFTKPEACAFRKRSSFEVGIDHHQDIQKAKEEQRLVRSIATILGSYAQSFNIQNNKTGSLFRKTKAKVPWMDELFNPEILEKKNYQPSSGFDYALKCFCYILYNPVKAGMVKTPEEWAYSASKDYAGLRNGTLCNKTLARKLFEIPPWDEIVWV